MRQVLLLILSSIASFTSFSQSITVSDSTITYGVLSSGVVNMPVSAGYGYCYGQTIYLENDIQGSGTITGLTFYWDGSTFSNSDSMTVFIATTDINNIDSIHAFKTTQMHQVFQGIFHNYTVPGAITIPLDSPYYYSGDSNLVIAINETKANGDAGFFKGFNATYSRLNRGRCWGNTTPWNLPLFDQTPGAFPQAGNGVAKITFQGLTPLPCQSPRNVRFGSITHNSALVAWSPPRFGNAPLGYDVFVGTTRYKPNANATLSATTNNPSDTQAVVSGLTPYTLCYAWVRNRSASCNSVWTVVDSFRTLCAPMATPNAPEAFNYTPVRSFPPVCWNRYRGTLNASLTVLLPETGTQQYWQGAPYKNQAGSDSAAKAFIRTDTLRHWLVTPAYDLGAGNKNIEFDAALTVNSPTPAQGYFDADDKFMVVVSTDEGLTWSSANALRTWTSSSPVIPLTGTHIILPLTGYSGIVRIGFYVQSTSGSPVGSNLPTLFIDNVKISTIMPVTLTEFTGRQQGTANLLQWRTATEQNNKGFELQRAAPAGSPGGGEMGEFGTIGFVATKARDGNSTGILSYSYTDAKPFAVDNYYRLKQIDKDGKTTLSNVVLIKGGESEHLALSALYPNPVRQTLNVLLNAPAAQRVQLVVTDMAGKMVRQQAAQLVKGDNNNTVNVAGLQKGNYILKVVCGNGCEVVGKFLKE